jgi:methionine synthase II (cobalamin-independent)
MEAPRGMATLIGSLPHKDAAKAVELVLQAVPNAPIWPQLPKRHWKEGFLPQYSEGLPGLVEHPEEFKVSIDTQVEDIGQQMAEFYEKVFAASETGDFSPFAFSAEASTGLPQALAIYRDMAQKPRFIKVHTTGPVSFALTVFDQEGKALFYNKDFADISLQNAIVKSRWQVRQFQPYAEKIICFLDEPVLSSYGSTTYINVTREAVVNTLAQAVDAIHEEGALVGVHVCGNSEWSILVDAGVDIINFDAFAFGEGLALYAPQIGPYLEKGGILAWGVVPTTPLISEITVGDLEKRQLELVAHLAAQGVDESLIWRQAMLTPSCGMGTMSEREAELVMSKLGALSERIQKHEKMLQA